METFYYYKLGSCFLFSSYKYDELDLVTEDEVKNSDYILYFLNKIEPLNSRRGFRVSSPSMLFLREESIKLLEISNIDYSIPKWLEDKINNGLVKSINTNYPTWKYELIDAPKKWRLNLIALGDVGSTLLIGLRLLGGENIQSIGIHDRNINRLKRWEYELNQIRRPFDEQSFPKVKPVDETELFDCDIFVFCASKGIPPVGTDVKDVRMAQFESNSEILSQYVRLARNANFKGIFAVVSDPVDLLCKVAFLESNKDSKGDLDFRGLAANQIIGYGLGVMNGRATFYAEQRDDTIQYLTEGRVFGPHGEGLIVADSVLNYNEELSNYLTDKTVNANKEIRALGFKPFVAPSLSSGALSILATINGDYFYGSTYMGDIYMGSKCRLTKSGIEIEQLKLPEVLKKKLEETHQRLRSII